MIIYEAEIITGHHEPEYSIGIFSELEYAKKEVEKRSAYIETLRVYALELQGKEYNVVGIWELDKYTKEAKWNEIEVD